MLLIIIIIIIAYNAEAETSDEDGLNKYLSLYSRDASVV